MPEYWSGGFVPAKEFSQTPWIAIEMSKSGKETLHLKIIPDTILF